MTDLTVSQRLVQLNDHILLALGRVGIKRVHRIGEALTDPPAVVIGVPSMDWGGPSHDPTQFTWPIAVVAMADDTAAKTLLDLVPRVGAALDTIAEIAVDRADPGVWTDGGTSLPCYEITCEVNL
jgi:hypothetical protein